ncbi:MAG: Lrp/AsnC family transcriptional regulator [Lentisphaerae bacterium]|nr:Lrp/AsnC family transcriptional regulator [Lentisphaerota bacterium]
MDDLLNLLKENARESDDTLAKMLNTSVEDVRKRITELEESGVIRAYQAVINSDIITDVNEVSAVIELRIRPEREGGFDRIAQKVGGFPQVVSIFLMSGAYDLMLIVKGKNLQEVALFVSSKLATIDGVLSTSTHFMLKTYKDQGVLMTKDEHDQRLPITP